ncbi:hypothetical protein RF11_00657 [Thelohanellus kitauei]|uniref:Uncharacterized protein n=1 Tax=Thelohanellus kitauei TaxID=669202 RepID=A0A0C2N8U6_THEKT|nr:hypothetical protein RF11_00657 [Thelohanellus kitauei]
MTSLLRITMIYAHYEGGLTSLGQAFTNLVGLSIGIEPMRILYLRPSMGSIPIVTLLAVFVQLSSSFFGRKKSKLKFKCTPKLSDIIERGPKYLLAVDDFDDDGGKKKKKDKWTKMYTCVLDKIIAQHRIPDMVDLRACCRSSKKRREKCKKKCRKFAICMLENQMSIISTAFSTLTLRINQNRAQRSGSFNSGVPFNPYSSGPGGPQPNFNPFRGPLAGIQINKPLGQGAGGTGMPPGYPPPSYSPPGYPPPGYSPPGYPPTGGFYGSTNSYRGKGVILNIIGP